MKVVLPSPRGIIGDNKIKLTNVLRKVRTDIVFSLSTQLILFLIPIPSSAFSTLLSSSSLFANRFVVNQSVISEEQQQQQQRQQQQGINHNNRSHKKQRFGSATNLEKPAKVTATMTNNAVLDIEELHQNALNENSKTYIDPKTGFMVFTEILHLKRGTCCGNLCRHCPYGWECVRGSNRKRDDAKLSSGDRVKANEILQQHSNTSAARMSIANSGSKGNTISNNNTGNATTNNNGSNKEYRPRKQYRVIKQQKQKQHFENSNNDSDSEEEKKEKDEEDCCRLSVKNSTECSFRTHGARSSPATASSTENPSSTLASEEKATNKPQQHKQESDDDGNNNRSESDANETQERNKQFNNHNREEKNVPYTKTGDQGTSSLFTGQRLSKDDIIFEALGTVDELCSLVGVVHAQLLNEIKQNDNPNKDNLTEYGDLPDHLLDVMSRLFDVGSYVAKPRIPEKKITSKDNNNRDDDEENSSSSSSISNNNDDVDDDDDVDDRVFSSDHIDDLEFCIDEMTDEMEELFNFILPTGCVLSSLLHNARTVCRRTERRLVPLLRAKLIDKAVYQYVNRLSDYLFTAARYCNHKCGFPDIQYRQPRDILLAKYKKGGNKSNKNDSKNSRQQVEQRVRYVGKQKT